MTQVKSFLEAEIVVVGAGLVGLSAAIALKMAGKKVVLVAANQPQIATDPDWDARVFALTIATQSWLKTLGVWPNIDSSRVNPIHAMHLWSQANEAPLKLSAEDANLSQLGVMIENQQLTQALWQTVNDLNVTVIADVQCAKLEHHPQQVVLQLSNHQMVSAKLLVAADGVHSWVRQQANIATTFKSFNQTAVVANFKAEKSHGNIARQWFTPHETMALLPLPHQMVALVWSVSTEKASQLLTGTTDALAQSVLEQSQGLLGELTLVSPTQTFALAQQTARQMIAERIVLVGDAGHQIHPMAGQGVNLGFRDVMELATLTTNTHAMMDIGDHGFLRQYERARKTDTLMMNSLTSGLDYLFAEQQPFIKQLTHWGFNQLKSQQNIKSFLIQQAAA